MNKRVKKKWLIALRSGIYRQAEGKLNDGRQSFCCLGVLCDIHSKETGKDWDVGNNCKNYMGRTGDLPGEVMKWAGLRHTAPACVHRKGRDLATLNDEGVGFKAIANVIEKQL